MNYTEAELAMMTPAEREGVDVELNDDGPSTFIDEAEVATANAAKIAADDAAAATKKASDDAAFALTDEGKAAAKVAEDAATLAATTEAARVAAAAKGAEPEAKVDATPFIPVYKAPLVTDQQYADQAAALTKQFEDGELTTPQYVAENNKITLAKSASDHAVRGAEQNEEQVWGYQQDQYFAEPGHAVLRDDPRMWAMMQADLELQYQDKANATKTNVEFLRTAGENVKTLLGLNTPAAKTKEPEKPKAQIDAVPIPKTLEGLPSADANADKAGGEFAHMGNLDGMAYENALARMTKEQVTRFLEI